MHVSSPRQVTLSVIAGTAVVVAGVVILGSTDIFTPAETVGLAAVVAVLGALVVVLVMSPRRPAADDRHVPLGYFAEQIKPARAVCLEHDERWRMSRDLVRAHDLDDVVGVRIAPLADWNSRSATAGWTNTLNSSAS